MLPCRPTAPEPLLWLSSTASSQGGPVRLGCGTGSAGDSDLDARPVLWPRDGAVWPGSLQGHSHLELMCSIRVTLGDMVPRSIQFCAAALLPFPWALGTKWGAQDSSASAPAEGPDPPGLTLTVDAWDGQERVRAPLPPGACPPFGSPPFPGLPLPPASWAFLVCVFVPGGSCPLPSSLFVQMCQGPTQSPGMTQPQPGRLSECWTLEFSSKKIS